MPRYEREKCSPLGCLHYLALSCVGVCAIALVWVVAFGYLLSRSVTPSRPNVSFELPDKAGHLTYHADLGVSLLSLRWIDMERDVLVVSNGGTRKFRLPCTGPHKHVGVYWYSEAHGRGPILEISDAGGESVLDLKTGKVGMLFSKSGQEYAAYYLYDKRRYRFPIRSWDGMTGVMSIKSADGTPAENLSSVVFAANCKYLGSVIRDGNKLRFARACAP